MQSYKLSKREIRGKLDWSLSRFEGEELQGLAG